MKTTVRLADSRGKTVYQQDRDVPLQLRREELKALGDSAFHYYDSFPVIPGRYRFSVLWENMVSKEFTSFEGSVVVPETAELTLGSLVAAKNMSEAAASVGRRGFQAGKLQLFPSPGNVFTPDSNFRLFFQVMGMTSELRASGSFEFVLAREGQAVRTTQKYIRDYGAGDGFLEPMTLSGLAPGRYALSVSVRDGEGRVRLSDNIPVEIVAEALRSTWVFSPKNPVPGAARYDYALGLQLLNLDRAAEASTTLARAREKDPASAEFAAAHGRALLLQGRAADAREALLPFADVEPARYEIQAELGQVAQALGDTKEAILRYVKALSLRGRVVEVLNSLGECYLSFGDREKAAKAWRDSLAINPNQEPVKKKLESLESEKEGAIK
jgi:tetratricopeptide (TPR) repeat protein